MIFFQKNKPTISKNVRKEFQKKIFNVPENYWILKHKVFFRSLTDIIDRCSDRHLKVLEEGKQILFLPSSGKFSCTIAQPANTAIILIFPELFQLLSSVDNTRGLAVIAHELGHIFHRHEDKNISTLEAQIEADTFALELNLAYGLVDILLEFNDLDSQTRVSYLTSKLLSNQHS